MTGVSLLASVPAENIMHARWFTALSIFVAINTVLYLTVAIIKLLPKVYFERFGPATQQTFRDSQHLPGTRPGLRRKGPSPAPCVRDARPTEFGARGPSPTAQAWAARARCISTRAATHAVGLVIRQAFLCRYVILVPWSLDHSVRRNRLTRCQHPANQLWSSGYNSESAWRSAWSRC